MSEPSAETVTRLYGTDASKSTGGVPVAVYGPKKMGLPLASVYAETSENVVGADVDPEAVVMINNSRCYVKQ